MWYIYRCWNGTADKAQLFQTAGFLESLMTQVSILLFTPAEAKLFNPREFLIAPAREMAECLAAIPAAPILIIRPVGPAFCKE